MTSSALSPLDDASKQIRLLRRRLRNAELTEFDITVWHLDNAPNDQAISYTWGPPPDSATISVNGELFDIRPNCYYALWQVGLHFPDAYIWTDSICIDQSNLEEKNQQVQMMGQIYTSAEGVLACVGPHANDSEQLYQRRVIEVPETWTGQDRVWMIPIMREFWTRSYWSRLWIVQELQLAKQVVILCGENRLGWKDLSVLPWVDDWTRYIPNSSAFLQQVAGGNPIKRDLWEAALYFHSRLCADPHDHVYALLSVSTADASEEPLKVDYSTSLPSLALEMIRYSRQRVLDEGGYSILRSLELCSGPGLDALVRFRRSIMHDTTNATKFDGEVLAASWNGTLGQDRPHVLRNQVGGFQAATFDADEKGELVLRRFDGTNDIQPPSFRWPNVADKPFASCSESVSEVQFEYQIYGKIFSMIARVASSARPGDLVLFRPREYVDCHHMPSVISYERDPAFTLEPQDSTELNSKHFKLDYAKLGSVVRWMGPGLWKVIGQAYISTCKTRGANDVQNATNLCFKEDWHMYLVHTIMSEEAAFLQWTMPLELWHAPSAARNAVLDNIVSTTPPSSYFYLPRNTSLEECREELDSDWKEKYCQ